MLWKHLRVAGRTDPEQAARRGALSDLITFVADRPGHDLRYAIDARKLPVNLAGCRRKPLKVECENGSVVSG